MDEMSNVFFVLEQIILQVVRNLLLHSLFISFTVVDWASQFLFKCIEEDKLLEIFFGPKMYLFGKRFDCQSFGYYLEKEYNLHFTPSLTDEEQRLYRIEQTFILKLGTVSKDNQAFVQPFIRTKTMEKRLKDLRCVIGSGKNYPVLLEDLARRTQMVLINNHEHTDMNKYIGCYVTDPLSGKLIFKEGILIKAMRNGWWVILDGLNLAPSEVLDARQQKTGHNGNTRSGALSPDFIGWLVYYMITTYMYMYIILLHLIGTVVK
ncbi:MDN1 midasin family protein [Reticulomyxa filosa]|uniref:MDN1 midasin family protein n=1 Tax=Reticulomyxa filosa TaxID=46433 RepID=X6N054_RETFI|nr:MDN1 midasin family protein [Reticulomyxa filosa]|eukprot:ETO18702.1 MDN1 midasin family protein [Reticulomyxa filosa]